MYDYVVNVVTRFDFGPSFQYRDRTVTDVIMQGFPVTLTYGFWSFVVAVIVGVSLGVVAAIKHNTWLDYLAVGISVGAGAPLRHGALFWCWSLRCGWAGCQAAAGKAGNGNI